MYYILFIKIYSGGPSTTTLMEIQIPVMDNTECKRAFNGKKVTVDERVICAGVLSGGKDACQVCLSSLYLVL